MRSASMNSHEARQPGEVVTFYSYKGGTGRTMSLVNMACLLAERLPVGERILLLDWDLEAPGLHRYFHGRLPLVAARTDSAGATKVPDEPPGLIDLFVQLNENGQQRDVKLKRKPDTRAKALLDTVDLGDHIVSTQVGNIDLLKAGRFDDGYGSRVNTFDWEAFYKDFPHAFRELAERLKARYRYVFIDSRTGQTDIAGICTALMPEKLVLVFTPNRQSLYGTETILRQALRYRSASDDARPLAAYPLPSRVDVTLDEIRAKWRFGDVSRQIEGYEPFFGNLLKSAYGLKYCHLKRYFEKVQVKHSPVYAFGEEIAVLNERTQRIEDDYSLTRAYQNLLEWFEAGFLPWQNPELIALMRTINGRSQGNTTEVNALAADLEKLQSLVKGLVGDGDFGNAELALRTGEREARQHMGPDSYLALEFLAALTQLLIRQSRLKEAGVLCERLMKMLDSSKNLPVAGLIGERLELFLPNALLLVAQGQFQSAQAALEELLIQHQGRLGETHPDCLAVRHQLAQLELLRGNATEAMNIGKQVVDLRQQVLGIEHPDTLCSKHLLGQALLAQGDVAGARALEDQVLADRRRVLGEEHLDTLASINSLAETLRAQRDLSGAKSLVEQVLTIRRRALGDEHPDTLVSMSNLASILRDQGYLSGAQTLEEQVLTVRLRQLGEEHPDTLIASGNLANILYAQGDLLGARALEERVLATRRRVLGDEHPDTLTAGSNLACTLRAQGDLSGARTLEEQVLPVRRRLLGDEHPDTLASMNNLSGTLSAQGDLLGARKLAEQVLSARRRLLGDEHPDTLSAMGNLAGALSAQGDLSGARTLEEQVYSARRRVLGDEHPDTLVSMNNLAGILHDQGDLSGARALEDQVVAIRCRVFGKEHPDTLTAIGNLAGTLREQGDLSTARKLEKQVLSARRRVLGNEHPDTLTSMNNLAGTLSAQGDLSEALELQEQVFDIRRRVLGEEHPDTLTAMNNLAGSLYAQKNFVLALTLQEQVLAIRRRVLGEEHPDTLTAMNNLAATLSVQGDLSGALMLQEQVVATRRRVLGEEHPNTLSAMGNLAGVLSRLGRNAEAKRLLRGMKSLRTRKTETSASSGNACDVRVIGVGGAGCNVINTLSRRMASGVQYIAVNTDARSLSTSPVSVTLQIGDDGLGAGANPEVGRLAALKSRNELRTMIEGAKLVFIVAGLGGGTGSGASPILAQVARELGVLTVAVVATPFSFEGSKRERVAAEAEKELLRNVDAMLVVPADSVFNAIGDDASMDDVFLTLNLKIQDTFSDIVSSVVTPGLINIDYEDLRAVFGRAGRLVTGRGQAKGDDRAANATEQALEYLTRDYKQPLSLAAGVMVNISAARNIRMKEVSLVMNRLKQELSPSANVIFGVIFNESSEDTLCVSIIAAGFGNTVATGDFVSFMPDAHS